MSEGRCSECGALLFFGHKSSCPSLSPERVGATPSGFPDANEEAKINRILPELFADKIMGQPAAPSAVIYQCNCGMAFETPEERTMHTSTCLVLTKPAPSDGLKQTMKALEDTFVHGTGILAIGADGSATHIPYADTVKPAPTNEVLTTTKISNKPASAPSTPDAGVPASPREWWIYQGQSALQAKHVPVVAWDPKIEGYVNVIEKSAFDAMVKERDHWIKAWGINENDRVEQVARLEAELRQTAGYELGRRAVEVTENALHKCQDELRLLQAHVHEIANNGAVPYVFAEKIAALERELVELRDATMKNEYGVRPDKFFEVLDKKIKLDVTFGQMRRESEHAKVLQAENAELRADLSQVHSLHKSAEKSANEARAEVERHKSGWLYERDKRLRYGVALESIADTHTSDSTGNIERRNSWTIWAKSLAMKALEGE